MKSKYLHFRVNEKEYQDLKQTCETTKTPISKALRVASILFVNDMEFRERILGQVNLN